MARSRSRDRGWPPVPEVLPHPIVDNHTHLDSVLDVRLDRGPALPGHEGAFAAPGALEVPDAPESRSDVPLTVDDHLALAQLAGVPRAVQIGCDLDSARWTDRLVRGDRRLVGGVAIHPNEVVRHARILETAPDGLEPELIDADAPSWQEALAEIEALTRGNDRIRVIGETGLDHFRAGEAGRAVQREAFRAHIALAKDLGLALQIHDRDAHADVLDVLARDGAPERTVFHCFSGDAEMARHCVERGWFLSFAGPVTFASNTDLREALHVAAGLGTGGERPGPWRVLIETDAPYLTPHPYRGRPNSPYLAAATVRAVAAELDADLAAVCREVDGLSDELYGPW